jgi:hypothetical protein
MLEEHRQFQQPTVLGGRHISGLQAAIRQQRYFFGEYHEALMEFASQDSSVSKVGKN